MDASHPAPEHPQSCRCAPASVPATTRPPPPLLLRGPWQQSRKCLHLPPLCLDAAPGRSPREGHRAPRAGALRACGRAELTEGVRTRLKWGMMPAPLDAGPHPTPLQSDTRRSWQQAAGLQDPSRLATPPPAFRGPRMRPVALVQVQRGLASEPCLTVPRSKTCRRSRLTGHAWGGGR